MADIVTIPILNPLNPVDRDRELPLNYNFKHFDEWLSNEQKLEFEQGKCYFQKWQTSDIIYYQFSSPFDPAFLKVINSQGVEVINLQFDVVGSIREKIYLQAAVALDTLDEGYYKVVVLVGDPVRKIIDHEIIHVKENHPGTILLKYSNKRNNTILWEHIEEMMFRIDAVIKYDKTVSARTSYTDQPRNASTVKGMPYRKFKMYIGQYGGVPDWQPDKIEEIFDQTDVTADGKGFSAPVSEMNVNRLERYAWAQWNMDLLETNNSREKRFSSAGLQDENISLSYTTTSKLFGSLDGETNDNTIEIYEIT